jgi:hypothetical protein
MTTSSQRDRIVIERVSIRVGFPCKNRNQRRVLPGVEPIRPRTPARPTSVDRVHLNARHSGIIGCNVALSVTLAEVKCRADADARTSGATSRGLWGRTELGLRGCPHARSHQELSRWVATRNHVDPTMSADASAATEAPASIRLSQSSPAPPLATESSPLRHIEATKVVGRRPPNRISRKWHRSPAARRT